MALTKKGVAYLAASFLTSQRQKAVADSYLAWLDAQPVADTAMDALLGSARSSKNSTKVLANADVLYNTLDVVPTIASIAPNTGPAAGGTATVITGLNLTDSTSVTFGGTAGTAFSVVNDTTINVTTPAKAAAAYDVVVVNPNGNATLPNGFTYA